MITEIRGQGPEWAGRASEERNGRRNGLYETID
jgi:hypothetical protein